MSIAKKLVTLLLLIVSFHVLKANAGSKLSIPLKNLGIESNPQVGQLILRNLDTRRRIFVGSNFSKDQLMAIYHKFSLGRSLSELDQRSTGQISFDIDEDLLKRKANPHLGFKVKAEKEDKGTIDFPSNQIIPWIQANGQQGTGTIKVNREVIFARPIIGDAEREDFLDFVNGINQARGSGGRTIKLDVEKFNKSPESYWELFQGIKTK